MDENGWKWWMIVDENGWTLMSMDESGWKWMKMDENGWKWMKMDENIRGSTCISDAVFFKLKIPSGWRKIVVDDTYLNILFTLLSLSYLWLKLKHGENQTWRLLIHLQNFQLVFHEQANIKDFVGFISLRKLHIYRSIDKKEESCIYIL